MVKKIISATIDQSLVKWLDELLKDSNEFRNKSHIIETALTNLKVSREEKHGKKR